MNKRARFANSIEAALERWCAQPFSWGGADCLLSLADIVNEVLGYDFAEAYRGRYSTIGGAMRLTHQFGGFDGALAHEAANRHWRPIHPRDALVGDIGIVKGDDEATCGVIRYRAGRWVGRSERGFAVLRSDRVAAAWRVS